MKIKDKPNFNTKPKPLTFSPDDTVRSALTVMCDNNIGSVVVVNKDQTVAGIVTERDMMIRAYGQDVNPDKTLLSEIMSKNIRVANENDDLLDWMKTMSNARFRHLPVVDAQGRLINIMSQGDFVAYTWPDLYDKIKKDLKGHFGRHFQFLILIFAIITLGLIAFKKT